MTTFIESAEIIQLGNFWMLKTSDGRQRQFKEYMLLYPNTSLKVEMDVLLTLDDGRITAIWTPPVEKDDSNKNNTTTTTFDSGVSTLRGRVWSLTTKTAKKVLTKEVLLAAGTGILTEYIRSKTRAIDIGDNSSEQSQKVLLGEFMDLWGKVVLKLADSYSEDEANMARIINQTFKEGRINLQDKETLHRIRKLRNTILHPENEQEHERAKRKVNMNTITALKTILGKLKNDSI